VENAYFPTVVGPAGHYPLYVAEALSFWHLLEMEMTHIHIDKQASMQRVSGASLFSRRDALLIERPAIWHNFIPSTIVMRAANTRVDVGRLRLTKLPAQSNSIPPSTIHCAERTYTILPILCGIASEVETLSHL
jgi:hypothetical protein